MNNAILMASNIITSTNLLFAQCGFVVEIVTSLPYKARCFLSSNPVSIYVVALNALYVCLLYVCKLPRNPMYLCKLASNQISFKILNDKTDID